MTALTAPRLTKRLNAEPIVYELAIPVKAATKIYGGSMVATDATGYAVPAATATGLRVWGVAEDTVDNTSGASGDVFIRVRRGAFNMNVGTSGDALAQADIGAMVYAIDDNTVGKTSASSTRSIAGKFLGFETDGTPYFELIGQVAA